MATGQPADFLIVPAYRECHGQAFRAAMEAVTTDRPHSAGNIPVIHADQSLKLHPFRSIQLCDAFGQGTGAVVIFSEPLDAGETNSLDNVFTDALADGAAPHG